MVFLFIEVALVAGDEPAAVSFWQLTVGDGLEACMASINGELQGNNKQDERVVELHLRTLHVNESGYGNLVNCISRFQPRFTVVMACRLTTRRQPAERPLVPLLSLSRVSACPETMPNRFLATEGERNKLGLQNDGDSHLLSARWISSGSL